MLFLRSQDAAVLRFFVNLGMVLPERCVRSSCVADEWGRAGPRFFSHGWVTYLAYPVPQEGGALYTEQLSYYPQLYCCRAILLYAPTTTPLRRFFFYLFSCSMNFVLLFPLCYLSTHLHLFAFHFTFFFSLVFASLLKETVGRFYLHYQNNLSLSLILLLSPSISFL